MMSTWSLPENDTRTGASHLRRGLACQDASGRKSLTDRSGQPIHLMVVADGHGGERYIHSDVGSRLACELAIDIAADQFSQWVSDETEIGRWQTWLERTFPVKLHQRWLSAVETHWRQESTEKEAAESSFSPLPYGSTVGVVIMTPTWWGHTGLGDWDLVRINSGGDVELINQEEEEGDELTGGEATYSLCQSSAPAHFAARTAVYSIKNKQPSFSLLLSTDGVRKSCSTDADFYTIAKYLCEGEEPRQDDAANELKQDLDRISSQGSGDDVSVAIGRWLLSEKSPSQQEVRRLTQKLKGCKPVIIQPKYLGSVRGSSTTKSLGESLPNHDDFVVSEIDSTEKQVSNRKPRRRGRLVFAGLILLCLGGLGVVACWVMGSLQGATKGESSAPSQELIAVLQKQADALCKPPSGSYQSAGSIRRTNNYRAYSRSKDKTRSGSDALYGSNETREIEKTKNNTVKSFTPREADNTRGNIEARDKISSEDAALNDPNGLGITKNDRNTDKPAQDRDTNQFESSTDDFIIANLNQRKSTFKALANNTTIPEKYFANPSQDPLSALIAWSLKYPYFQTIPISSTQSSDSSSFLLGMLPSWIKPGENTAPQTDAIGVCFDLRAALKAQWARVDRVLENDSSAKGAIEKLYAELSAKNFEASRGLYGVGASDQFSSEFYRQFQLVEIAKLLVINSSETIVNLEGEVTFIWPDGSTQKETRSFTVDISSDPALIIASEFSDVIAPRTSPKQRS